MNQKKGIPEEIREHISDDEKILWWAKPDLKILSVNESIVLTGSFLVIFFVALRASEFYIPTFIDSLRVVSPLILIYFIGLLTFWLSFKAHIWFIITDKRAIYIKNYLSFRLAERKLSDIRFFEIRGKGVGNRLYIGKYRPINAYVSYDYEKGYKDYFNGHTSPLREEYFSDYLNFFSLKDASVPAEIIQANSNAVAYVDPKYRKKK